MFRRFVRLAFMALLCAWQLPVIAQSYPKAYAYYAPRPAYPISARLKHIEGSGIFTVNIDQKRGFVTSVTVKKSTGSKELDEAAIDALRRWKFRVPTKASADVPLSFVL